MTRPRIAMVGGGSFHWCPRLVRDILAAEELSEADFRLLDIDRERADLVAAAARTHARESHPGATFLSTTHPDRAFDGADIVIITISTGGLDAMAHDLRIPERYGIFQTVGDTVGPGGWARGLRNIPAFMKLARKIVKNCPRAAILNYTNPMSVLTKTLSVTTDQPVVGLCHGLFEVYHQLMRIFDLDSEDDLSAHYCGINHFFWILDFAVRGKPGYPMLRRKLRGGKTYDDLLSDAFVDEAGFNSIRRLIAGELYDTYGYLPYTGDRHTCEFFSRYVTSREQLKAYHLARTPVSARRKLLAAAKRYVVRLAKGAERLPEASSRETAANIASAYVAGKTFMDVMNLPNEGQAPNLPAGAILETPGIVDGLGFSPVACGPMPAPLVELTMPHIINQSLIVEAGIEGDWSKAFQALIGDPACAHLAIPRIREMGRKLLEANREHLPQFFSRKKVSG